MTNQVPKTDGRGFPSGAYLNQNHPMDRTQWLEDTFPEWGSFLNQEIENYEVPKGQVSLWSVSYTHLTLPTTPYV